MQLCEGQANKVVFRHDSERVGVSVYNISLCMPVPKEVALIAVWCTVGPFVSALCMHSGGGLLIECYIQRNIGYIVLISCIHIILFSLERIFQADWNSCGNVDNPRRFWVSLFCALYVSVHLW